MLINYAPKDGWATSHGDIFSIWGAKCTPDRPHFKGIERCLPSENRVKGGGEWNHYKVIANDGAIKLHVNGKEVSGVTKSNPRKGYLALESEGVECHFKNIKLKELPSTNPKPEECAKVAEGHVSILNGLNLDGWKAEKGAWKVSDGVLRAAGKSDVLTEAKFGNCELVFDWKRPAKADNQNCTVLFDGARTTLTGAKPGAWTRGTVTFKDGRFQTRIGDGKPSDWAAPAQALTTAHIGFAAAEGLEVRNLFVRELKGGK